MFKDWNFWFSVITAIVAVIALFQTNRQIRLGNKQHLFDMRIEYYLIAKGMMQLFDKNSNILDEDKKNDMLAIEFVFAQMTNNTYLEKISSVISHPLEEPYHKVAKLYFLEERSVDEIAEILGRPRKTVETQVYRARQKLQKMLMERGISV